MRAGMMKQSFSLSVRHPCRCLNPLPRRWELEVSRENAYKPHISQHSEHINSISVLFNRNLIQNHYSTNMQFNILSTLAAVALATIVHGAQLSPLEVRQSTCSITSGCNCFVGTVDVDVLNLPVTVNTCGLQGQTCNPAGAPLTGTILGLASFSLAIGSCS